MRALLGLVVFALYVGGLWKVFTKAGQPGILSLIPGLNVLVLLKIVGKPWWWALLLLVPGLNVIVSVLIGLRLARAFDQSLLFGVGLLVLGPVFVPLLGLGDARYCGAPRS